MKFEGRFLKQLNISTTFNLLDFLILSIAVLDEADLKAASSPIVINAINSSISSYPLRSTSTSFIKSTSSES